MKSYTDITQKSIDDDKYYQLLNLTKELLDVIIVMKWSGEQGKCSTKEINSWTSELQKFELK